MHKLLYRWRFINLFFYWAFCTLAVWAAPKNLADYEELLGGLVKLTDGSVIEGSLEHGGKLPDIVIDVKSPEFQPILEFAKNLKNEKMSPLVKANKIIEYINKEILLERNLPETPINKTAKTVPLSSFIACRKGDCRQHSILLHLALTEAGVENRLAYVKMQSTNMPDHGLVILPFEQKIYVVDAYKSEYNSKTVASLLKNEIESLNLFPRYWIPKSEIEKMRTPLSTQISYADFEELVRSSVAKIPDLKKLWKESSLPKYIGGGLVRGLLKWHWEQLRSYSVEEIKKMNLPSTEELLLQADADKDLYVENKKQKIIDLELGKKGWDVSSLQDFEESVKGGGSTLDKILLSPDKILDPLNGLKDFHEGRLEFVEVPGAAKTYWFKEHGNSKTAQALRYLRFMVEFPNLKPTEKAKATLLKIGSEETALLKEKNLYTINRAFDKFFKATLYDPTKVLKFLYEYGLLTGLGQLGVKVSHPSVIPLAGDYSKKLGLTVAQREMANSLLRPTKLSSMSLDDFFAFKPTIKEIHAKMRACDAVDGDKEVLLRALKEMNFSSTEYVELLTPKGNEEIGGYTKMLGEVIVETLDHLAQTKPSIDQVKILIQKSTGHPDQAQVIFDWVFKTLPLDINEFIKLSKYIGASYNEAVAKVITDNLNVFWAENPSIKQVRQLLKLGFTEEEFEQILNEAITHLKLDSDGFISLLKFNKNDLSSSYYFLIIDKVISKNSDLFFKTKPSAKQFEAYFNLTLETSEDKKIIAKGIQYFKPNAPEMIELIKKIGKGQAEGKYLQAESALEHLNLFMSKKPSIAHFIDYLALTDSGQTGKPILITGLERFTWNSKNFLALVEQREGPKFLPYRQMISEVIVERSEQFFNSKPTSEEVLLFLDKLAPSSDEHLRVLLKLALARATTPESFLELGLGLPNSKTLTKEIVQPLLAAELTHFWELNPTTNQVNLLLKQHLPIELKAYLNESKHLLLIEQMLKCSTSVTEFRESLGLKPNFKPSPQYLADLTHLAEKHHLKFIDPVSGKPSPDDFKKLFHDFPGLQTSPSFVPHFEQYGCAGLAGSISHWVKKIKQNF